MKLHRRNHQNGLKTYIKYTLKPINTVYKILLNLLKFAFNLSFVTLADIYTYFYKYSSKNLIKNGHKLNPKFIYTVFKFIFSLSNFHQFLLF